MDNTESPLFSSQAKNEQGTTILSMCYFLKLFFILTRKLIKYKSFELTLSFQFYFFLAAKIIVKTNGITTATSDATANINICCG